MLSLNHVLHFPTATKTLAFVHRVTYDSIGFIEYHPSYFLIKDHATKLALKEMKVKVLAEKVKAEDARIMMIDPSGFDAIAREYWEMRVEMMK
jgi:hypothetical protein